MTWNLSVTYPFFSPRIRVRERLSRDETAQRPPDCSPDQHQANKQRAAQYTPQRPEPTQQKTVPQPQHSPSHHPTHSQTASAPEYQHSGPAVNSQPYVAIPTNAKLPGPPEVQPRRRMSADQMFAAHREARLECRPALKEEAHTEGLLKSRKAVLPSEIRRRERSVDDIHRGRHEDMDWQNYSPELRSKSQREEDWDPKRLRERGRERNVERIRGRGKEPVSIHESQDERVFRSMQPNHTSVHHQPRQIQSSEPVYHEESQIQEQEPQTQQQSEPIKRQHGAQNQQQDSKRQYQYDHSRQPQDPQRQQLSQKQQQYELQRQEPPSHQQDLQGKQQVPHLEEEFEPQRQHQDPSGHQRFDSAVYLQKDSSLPQAKHRSLEMSGGPKPKTRTRSMSDIGLSKHSAIYHMDRASASRDTTRAIPPSVMANGEMSMLDTRVSVAQLRHSYLENASRKLEL